MIDKTQAELAKTLWEQSKAAAVQAHGAWDLMIKSQKSVMDSMRGTGAPFAAAADQFDKLVEFQSKQYQAALDYMDKMSAEFQQVLGKTRK